MPGPTSWCRRSPSPAAIRTWSRQARPTVTSSSRLARPMAGAVASRSTRFSRDFPGRDRDNPARPGDGSVRLVGLRVVEEIGRHDVDADEDDVAVGLVLPPVAVGPPLRIRLAGTMDDRHVAGAAVLDGL